MSRKVYHLIANVKLQISCCGDDNLPTDEDVQEFVEREISHLNDAFEVYYREVISVDVKERFTEDEEEDLGGPDINAIEPDHHKFVKQSERQSWPNEITEGEVAELCTQESKEKAKVFGQFSKYSKRSSKAIELFNLSDLFDHVRDRANDLELGEEMPFSGTTILRRIQ